MNTQEIITKTVSTNAEWYVKLPNGDMVPIQKVEVVEDDNQVLLYSDPKFAFKVLHLPSACNYPHGPYPPKKESSMEHSRWYPDD